MTALHLQELSVTSHGLHQQTDEDGEKRILS